MKYLILILMLSMLGFSACDSSEKKTDEPEKMESTEHLFETKWEVAELNGQAVVLANDEKDLPYLVLRKEENKTMGFGGCNRFNGTFKMDGSSIEFSGVAATKMFCEDVMQVEDVFFTSLQEITSYELSSDTLLLMNADGDAIIKLQAE